MVNWAEVAERQGWQHQGDEDRNFNFIMHCGAEEISIEDLRNLTTPPADAKTGWTPIPHADFQDRIREELTRGGLEVVQESHAITHNRKHGDVGDRYFGFLRLGGDNGICEIVGLRNSHDKTFSASLVMGMGVFVCDNLSFSGEVKVARKHTRYIERDLPLLAARAVSNLHNLRGWQEMRVGAYREFDLDSRTQVHDIIMQCFRSQALPSSHIGKVIEAWEEQPVHEKYAEEFGKRNAWSLFNAFTEVYKTRVNPHVLSQRTQVLHGVFDNHVGLVKPAAFEEVS